MSGDHYDESVISGQVRRLETLLEERDLVDGPALDAAIDRFLSTSSPANGARVVARAWVNEDFRLRLLDDANSAIADVGLTMRGGLQEQRLRVVANAETVHNVIVCTLCSCYPIALLGPSPSWYKSEAYRSRVVREPRAVLAEFGVELAEHVEIVVWDSTAESRYMVLPRRPDGTQRRSEDELAGLVTRNALIGTAIL